MEGEGDQVITPLDAGEKATASGCCTEHYRSSGGAGRRCCYIGGVR